MGSLVHGGARERVGWCCAGASVVPRCASQHAVWGAAFSGSCHVEKQILKTLFLLQEEENVGGKDSKPQQESPDPELPGGKRELYLEGFITSLFFRTSNNHKSSYCFLVHNEQIRLFIYYLFLGEVLVLLNITVLLYLADLFVLCLSAQL